MKQPLHDSITPNIQRIVLLLSVLAALPHALHLPLFVTLYFLGLVIWRFSSLQLPGITPGRLLLLLLTLVGVLLVYSQHQTLIGRDAGVSLLTIMLALKLLELRRRRDLYVITFISYFVVVTQFLFSQAFLLAVYLLLMVICLTALLLEINRVTPSRQLLYPFTRTLLITLQALPIAAILFILFPRLGQPIWQFGAGAHSAVTGLAERISPGSISQLIRSSAVAFRVQFEGQAPAPEQRYWRGLVLWDTDGWEWFNQGQAAVPGKPLPLEQVSMPIAYEVLLEPHHQRWLFALDLPATAPPGTGLSHDYQLSAASPVQRVRPYRLVSYTDYRTQAEKDALLQRALQLPENVTEQELALVKAWRRQADSDQAVVQLALRHFNTQPFVYTLTPPRYEDNPIQQFLFEGREGFCEHYASSFTLLMRLAGIPTRLVVGYQGGEFNPVGDYFILRQSDAHAWTEVWLPGQGWTRVDPTAAVAPERVRRPIQADFGALGSPVVFQIEDAGLLGGALKQLGLVLDAANIGWRRWILDYSRDKQSSLLRNLGFNFTRVMEWTVLMLSLTGLVLLLIGVRLTLQGRQRLDPVVKSYLRLCNKLASVGLARRSNEGPLDYSRRIASTRPDLSVQIRQMIAIYIRLRYGRHPSKRAAQEFHRLVRHFRPRKARVQQTQLTRI